MGECSMNAKCPKCEQIITNVDLELGPVGNCLTKRAWRTIKWREGAAERLSSRSVQSAIP